VLVRADRCIACKSCEIACIKQHLDENHDPNSRPPSVSRIKVEHGPSGLPLASVSDPEEKIYRCNPQQIFVVLCQHCDDAECIEACAAGALTRDPDGTVRHHPELCNGCLLCMEACPIGAIYPDPTGKAIVKCDLCGGRETPSCVEACKVDALYLESIL
jgi:anaerobic carbon-monoxide dehydrogenase iron sulfur subunit